MKWRAAPSDDLEPDNDLHLSFLEIMKVRHPSISVKQTVAESNISEVFLLPLKLSATVLRIERRLREKWSLGVHGFRNYECDR